MQWKTPGQPNKLTNYQQTVVKEIETEQVEDGHLGQFDNRRYSKKGRRGKVKLESSHLLQT